MSVCASAATPSTPSESGTARTPSRERLMLVVDEAVRVTVLAGVLMIMAVVVVLVRMGGDLCVRRGAPRCGQVPVRSGIGVPVHAPSVPVHTRFDADFHRQRD